MSRVNSLKSLDLQLEQVKLNMLKQVKTGDAYLDGSLDYVLKTSGKMLRPKCLLIGSRLGKNVKKKEDELIGLATVIETMHLATLIHDDIIDEALTRRNQPSAWAKYGQSYAVYMGDYLLSQCFLTLSYLKLDKDLAIALAKAVRRICLGDMKQNKMRYNKKLSPFSYIKIVSGKTAALFAIAMSSGAYHAKAEETHVKLLGRIGYEVGMAFQVLDDLLDFEGDANLVGKEVQVDLKRGYYSLPVIFSLAEQTEESEILRELLTRQMSDEDVNYAILLIKKTKAIDKTRALALEYNHRAMALVEQLPQGETATLLKQMLPPLMSRLN
jgi:heptaprenyl diphosphate synthase